MKTHPLITQLRKARQTAGLTQADIASDLHLNPRSVGQWERGERTPPLRSLDRYASLLGMKISLTPEEEEW